MNTVLIQQLSDFHQNIYISSSANQQSSCVFPYTMPPSFYGWLNEQWRTLLQIYIDVLENNLWPVIAQYFTDNKYVSQDDNAPVHRARNTEKQENNIKCTKWKKIKEN
jgi:hypothetical protein